MKNSELTLKVIDGKTRACSNIDLESTASCTKHGSFEVSTKLENGGAEDCRCTASFRNLADTQLWLEVRFKAKASFAPEKYWDGRTLRDFSRDMLAVNADPADNPQPLPDKLFPLDPEFKKKVIAEAGGNTQVLMNIMFSGPCTLNVFPVSCVYDKAICLALGANPHQLFSYYSSGIEDGILYKSVKLVIDPGMTESVEFIEFKTPAKYGYLEAVARYYELFPECYTRRQNIDQRICGVAETSQYKVEHAAHELLREDRRRFKCDWIWSMHANSEIGLAFPEADDYNPHGTFVEEPALGKSREEFLDYVRQAYEWGDQSAAMAFYVLPQVLDWRIMKEKYPDAEWVDSKNATLAAIDFSDESNHLKYAPAGAILPWGNSFQARMLSDFKNVAEKIRPSAFAFDNVEGPRMDFAQHAQNCPGRAFSDGKVYVTQGVAYGKLMEYVRELPGRKPGLKMGVTGNHPGSYHTAAFTDAAIFEAGPWTDTAYTAAMRLDMGEKPLVYWGPKEFPDFELYKGAALEKKLTEINYWLFLFALRYGILPNAAHNLKGYALMRERLPLLKKLQAAGWKPVPGAQEISGMLALQRYGRNYLAVVNETEKSVDSVITIETKYFDDTKQLHAIYGPIPDIRHEAGVITVRLTLPPRSAIVFSTKREKQPAERIKIIDPEKILDFKFIAQGLPATSIILEQTGLDEKPAHRIVAYFKYFHLMKTCGSPENYLPKGYYQVYLLYELRKAALPEIPVLSGIKPEPGMVVFKTIAENCGVKGRIEVKDGILYIATVPGYLDEAVLKLLDLLDGKYSIEVLKWFTMRRLQDSKEHELMGALR